MLSTLTLLTLLIWFYNIVSQHKEYPCTSCVLLLQLLICNASDLKENKPSTLMVLILRISACMAYNAGSSKQQFAKIERIPVKVGPKNKSGTQK